MRVFIGMSNKTLYLRIGNLFRQIRKGCGGLSPS